MLIKDIEQKAEMYEIRKSAQENGNIENVDSTGIRSLVSTIKSEQSNQTIESVTNAVKCFVNDTESKLNRVRTMKLINLEYKNHVENIGTVPDKSILVSKINTVNEINSVSYENGDNKEILFKTLG